MKWLKSGAVWSILVSVLSALAANADSLSPKTAVIVSAAATVIGSFSKQPHKDV